MHFLPHALCHALEQGGASAEDDVGEQVSSNVGVALHHRVEAVLVNTFGIVAGQAWLEEDLWAFQTLLIHRDGLRAR